VSLGSDQAAISKGNHVSDAFDLETNLLNFDSMEGVRSFDASQPSAIPPITSISLDVEEEKSDDNNTPFIPIIPIEEEESMTNLPKLAAANTHPNDVSDTDSPSCASASMSRNANKPALSSGRSNFVTKKKKASYRSKKFNTAVANMDSRWSTRRLDVAVQLIVEAVKEDKAMKLGSSGMTRKDERDAARFHIGDTGLLNYVLKSLNNVIVGNYVKATVYASNDSSSCFLTNTNTTIDATLTFKGNTYNVPAWYVSLFPEEYHTAKVNNQTSIMVKRENKAKDVREALDFLSKLRESQLVEKF